MMTFVSIPAGAFLMGSAHEGQDDERPVHQVIVDHFEMGAWPVTRGEYGEFLRATGHPSPRDWDAPHLGGDDRPVVGVSWLDAMAWCDWRLAQGDPVRLPTEAEWERAARGGREQQRYPWGDALPAWVPDAGRGPLQGPWPATLGDPNGFGLYGIAGNVHEWCADWHDAGWYAVSPAHNPAGPSAGLRRASRGGSWRHAVTVSRCAARSKLDPSFRYTDYGFRVVRSR